MADRLHVDEADRAALAVGTSVAPRVFRPRGHRVRRSRWQWFSLVAGGVGAAATVIAMRRDLVRYSDDPTVLAATGVGLALLLGLAWLYTVRVRLEASYSGLRAQGMLRASSWPRDQIGAIRVVQLVGDDASTHEGLVLERDGAVLHRLTGRLWSRDDFRAIAQAIGVPYLDDGTSMTRRELVSAYPAALPRWLDPYWVAASIFLIGFTGTSLWYWLTDAEL